jgi:hypothetical protein
MSLRLENGIMDTAIDYFVKQGRIPDKEDCDDYIDEENTGVEGKISIKEYQVVEEIITCQISLFCLRRISHCCGSNVDIMHRMIQRKIKQYEETYGREFINTNKELIW